MYNPEKISLNFILSTGRTGSTLLSTMLNMHPEIISISEEPFAYNLFPKYKNVTNWDDKKIEEFCYDFYLFSEGKLEPQFGTKDDLYKILKDHQDILTVENAIKLAYFAFNPNKDKSYINTIVDKELKYHHFLDEVFLYYPQSKFILLTRDPRDNVLTKYKRAIKQQKRASIMFFSKTWNYEYSTLISKLQSTSKERYIIIKYEDLVSFPEKTLQEICDFLNKKYTADVLKYYEYTDVNNITSNQIGLTVQKHLKLFHQGLSSKVNTDKIGNWKKEFTEKQNDLIWTICCKTAKKLNYHEEKCKEINYFSLLFPYGYFRFLSEKIIIPFIYYNIPYSMKYCIKKIKYGKNFKDGKWATKNFYETTLPKTR